MYISVVWFLQANLHFYKWNWGTLSYQDVGINEEEKFKVLFNIYQAENVQMNVNLQHCIFQDVFSPALIWLRGIYFIYLFIHSFNIY